MKGIIVVLLSVFSWQVSGSEVVSVVSVVEGGENKNILADKIGKSLYVFDMDSADQSACSSTCAEKWPPLLLSGDEVGKLGKEFSVMDRGNGLKQLKFKDRLVYTFYLDRTAGDIKGDGAGGVWHKVEL